MRIFIIGGTENISSPITRVLLRQGHEVTLYNHDAQPPTWIGAAKVVAGDRKDYAALERSVGEWDSIDCAIDMLCFDPGDAESDIRAFRGRARQLIMCSMVSEFQTEGGAT
jgi:nucleoside-diphosphate-sugar epimerase